MRGDGNCGFTVRLAVLVVAPWRCFTYVTSNGLREGQVEQQKRPVVLELALITLSNSPRAFHVIVVSMLLTDTPGYWSRVCYTSGSATSCSSRLLHHYALDCFQ
jgi:hypothetical protein